MTAKQFDRAMGTFNGHGKIERIIMAAMGICLIAGAPFAYLNYRLLIFNWVSFTALYICLEYIQLSCDPAYPSFSRKKSDDNNIYASLSDNRKMINAAALFPADRLTAVRAFQNKRLCISLCIVLGLIAQGAVLIKTDIPVNSSPLIIGTSFITLSYNFISILMTVKKGLGCAAARNISCIVMLSIAVTSLSMIPDYEIDKTGMGVGTVFLINAAITLLISLATYRKCLHDAENTARNGEKIGEEKL